MPLLTELSLASSSAPSQVPIEAQAYCQMGKRVKRSNSDAQNNATVVASSSTVTASGDNKGSKASMSSIHSN